MAISLSKGSSISLEKEAPGLSAIRLGLGWGLKKSGLFGKGQSVDLDASCIMMNEAGSVLDTVWFGQLKSKDGSVQHSGDDVKGGGGENEPNEEININLSRVPSGVVNIFFTVNSFSGETFKGIPRAFCTLRDSSTNKEVAHYDLSIEGGKHTALVIAKLHRENDSWGFCAVGEWGNGITCDELYPLIKTLI